MKSLAEIERLKEATTEGTCWLEDGVCKECANKPLCNAVNELADICIEQRGMLNKLQFVENSGQIGGAIYKFCPVCGNANIQGHKKDCELAKLVE